MSYNVFNFLKFHKITYTFIKYHTISLTFPKIRKNGSKNGPRYSKSSISFRKKMLLCINTAGKLATPLMTLPKSISVKMCKLMAKPLPRYTALRLVSHSLLRNSMVSPNKYET